MTANKTVIKRWMRAQMFEYVDSCNEVDCTGLAEAAAYHFDDVPDNGRIAEIYYEIAMSVSLSRLSKMSVERS